MSQIHDVKEPQGRVRRVVIFGDIGRQYAVERRPDAALAVAELRDGESPGELAVEYLRPADTATSKITVVSDAGEELSSIRLSKSMQTWSGINPDPGFATLLTEIDAGGAARIDLESLSPLMIIRSHRRQESNVHEVLACTRLREVGVLFARVAALTTDEDIDLGRLVRRASAAAGALHEYVGTDFQLYKRFEPDTEIELKIGLKDSVSPWRLASSIARSVGRGEFDGFIPDVGNEHQRWQSSQDTFEVTGPPEEAGYIAFITLSPNKYLVKRKRFVRDSLRREETFNIGVEIPDSDFSGYIRDRHQGTTTRPLPFFTRAKFDVNVESAATGHFFGIEIDEVTVPDHQAILRQIEIEYHRSRIHHGVDANRIDEEIERLARLVERHIRDLGVHGERTFYSKLSFLRDLVGEA